MANSDTTLRGASLDCGTKRSLPRAPRTGVVGTPGPSTRVLVETGITTLFSQNYNLSGLAFPSIWGGNVWSYSDLTHSFLLRPTKTTQKSCPPLSGQDPAIAADHWLSCTHPSQAMQLRITYFSKCWARQCLPTKSSCFYPQCGQIV